MGLSVSVAFPGQTLVFMVLKISMLNCFRLQCHGFVRVFMVLKISMLNCFRLQCHGFVRECCISWSNSCFYGSKNIHVKLL